MASAISHLGSGDKCAESAAVKYDFKHDFTGCCQTFQTYATFQLFGITFTSSFIVAF